MIRDFLKAKEHFFISIKNTCRKIIHQNAEI